MHKTTPGGSRAKGVDAAGILFSRDLPDKDFDGLWESIILDKELKDRLHAQAALNFTLRPRVKRDRVPLHGIILLVGPPFLVYGAVEILTRLPDFGVCLVNSEGRAAHLQMLTDALIDFRRVSLNPISSMSR